MESKDAVLKTLLYADIFDYPLTHKEIYRFLISSKKIQEKELQTARINLKNIVETKNGFYFLKTRQEIVSLREKRDKESLEKIKTAKKIIKRIGIIPSIKFIGISGALSMNNSDKDDDIDIFVISEAGLVWTSRALLILFLKALGVYRGRVDKDYSNKICLNMILGSEKISFEKKEQDLYLAHEIAQLIPIFNKDKTYEEFMKSNEWVKGYLPNTENKISFIKKQSGFLDFLLNNLFKIFQFEKILGFLEKEYMKRNITKETIKKGYLAFHPFDYKAYVLGKYNTKLKAYKLSNRTNKTRI